MCLLGAVSYWRKAGERLCVTHNLLAQEQRHIISLMEELSPPVLGNEAGTEEICLFWFQFCPNSEACFSQCQKYLP